MTHYTDKEIYILKHLTRSDLNYGRLPLSNLVCALPMSATDVLETLRSLEAKKLIKLKGAATFAMLEQLIAAAGDIQAPAVTPDGRRWVSHNSAVFQKDQTNVGHFFATDACLTLRGFAALPFIGKQPLPAAVAAPKNKAPKP